MPSRVTCWFSMFHRRKVEVAAKGDQRMRHRTAQYEVSSGCVQRLLSHDYINHMSSMINSDLYYQ